MRKRTLAFKSAALTVAAAMMTAQISPVGIVYASQEILLDERDSVTDAESLSEDVKTQETGSSVSETITTTADSGESVSDEDTGSASGKGSEVLLEDNTESSVQKDSEVVLEDGTDSSSQKNSEAILEDETKQSGKSGTDAVLEEGSDKTGQEGTDEATDETDEDVTHDIVFASSELPKELLLGIFFNSQEDQSDTLYVSFDGLEFRKIGYAFEDSNKTSSAVNEIVGSPHLLNPSKYPSYVVNCLHDPSLQFHNGNYWSMSGFTTNRSDGTRVFVPMLASSPDLVNWTYPNSGSSTNVAPTLTPYGKSGNRDNANNFDTVAPDLLIEDNGTAWIVVCMGYYAQFNGDESKNDKMSPYLVKVTGLKPGSTNPVNIDEKGKQPILQYGNAIPINLPTNNYKNRIDGSLYKENGIYYLAIKDNGVTNEIWSINDLNKCQDSTQWKLVNKNVVTGYEGPWLTKYMGRYYCFTDQLETYPPDSPSGKTGIHMSSAAQLNKDWLKNREIKTIDASGKVIPNRHGAVITIKDSTQINRIMNLYYKAGWKKYDPQKDKPGTPNQIWGYDSEGKAYWYENGEIQGVKGDKKNIWKSPPGYKDEERGREIADVIYTNAWYWLDCIYGGAAAKNKEVWMPYVFQEEHDKGFDIKAASARSGMSAGQKAEMAAQVEKSIREGTGKWVRYDYQGKMIKGWYYVDPNGPDAKIYPNQIGNIYYYDEQTGLMAKGETKIKDESGNIITHYFNETTGVLTNKATGARITK